MIATDLDDVELYVNSVPASQQQVVQSSGVAVKVSGL
jgi:hypothetical protein